MTFEPDWLRLVIWFYLVTTIYKKVFHALLLETARGVGVLPHVYTRSSAARLLYSLLTTLNETMNYFHYFLVKKFVLNLVD